MDNKVSLYLHPVQRLSENRGDCVQSNFNQEEFLLQSSLKILETLIHFPFCLQRKKGGGGGERNGAKFFQRDSRFLSEIVGYM